MSSGLTTTLQIELDPESRAVIDQAAQTAGKSSAEFVAELARREAQEQLLDQRHFVLDSEAFAAFVAALDEPPEVSPKLKAFLDRPPVWEE